MKLISAVPFVLAFAFSTAYAGEPVVDISPQLHPHLHQAQQSVVQAYNQITVAQKDNRYDMKGNATKAKQLLEQASIELKAAATTANEAKKK